MSEEDIEHIWWDWRGIICCRVCGVVKRADGLNSPCKGPTRMRPLETTYRFDID